MEPSEKKDEIKEISKALETKIVLSNQPEEEAFEQVSDKNEDHTEEAIKSKAGEEAGLENLVEENDLLAKNLSWDEMGIRAEVKTSLLEMGFVKPSKIQSTTYPLIMKKPYSHLIAQALNGAGKTGAFGLGIISRVDEEVKGIQGVVFGHTRELVNQIAEVLTKMTKNTKIKVSVLLSTDKNYDNLGHIIVLTPGAFEKKFIQKKTIPLIDLKVIVLDEADYMITDEGTSPIIKKTFTLFKENNLGPQVLFFSATFSQENFQFIKKYFKKANMIELKKESLTLKNVRQLYWEAPQRKDKVGFVEEYLKRNGNQERVIIFVNSRAFTTELQKQLIEKGYKVFILMGGDMDRANRDETIKRFNKGEIQILITTNLLARGYDEKLVKLVINFDIPVTKNKSDEYVSDPETYLHRIGRTGRFGSKGIGLTLISGDRDKQYLKDIEQHYNSSITEIKSLDEVMDEFKKFLYNQY